MVIIQQQTTTAHRNTELHWLPQPAEKSTRTACGKDIDGPCSCHFGTDEYCRYGLAWTRSTDLASYQSRPYEQWPPPCPECMKAIG